MFPSDHTLIVIREVCSYVLWGWWLNFKIYMPCNNFVARCLGFSSSLTALLVLFPFEEKIKAKF